MLSVKNPSWAKWTLGFTGVIQTIPGLALLALFIPIPFLGLGSVSAITALFLYSLLPILRNTYAGMNSVDGKLLDAAKGIGLAPNEVLLQIQFRMAVPMIMAGVRTASVIAIGVGTLGAFIGAGGLGEPIITGLQLNDHKLIWWGALPAALLAISAEYGLAFVERWATPRGLRGSQ